MFPNNSINNNNNFVALFSRTIWASQYQEQLHILVVIHNGRLQNTVKSTPFPLSTLGHTPSPSCGRPQTWLNTQWLNSDSWTSSNYQMSVSDCCWHWQDTVLAAGCQRVITIYLLPIPRMPQSTCCELWFIQLVTLSLFLSLSTVLHCYTLWTFTLAKTLPLSAFVRTGPYPSLWMSFTYDYQQAPSTYHVTTKVSFFLNTSHVPGLTQTRVLRGQLESRKGKEFCPRLHQTPQNSLHYWWYICQSTFNEYISPIIPKYQSWSVTLHRYGNGIQTKFSSCYFLRLEVQQQQHYSEMWLYFGVSLSPMEIRQNPFPSPRNPTTSAL